MVLSQNAKALQINELQGFAWGRAAYCRNSWCEKI